MLTTKIVIGLDTAENKTLYENLLKENNYVADIFIDKKELLDTYQSTIYDIVILDFDIYAKELENIKNKQNTAKIIIITSTLTKQKVAKYMTSIVDDCIPKPPKPELLLPIIKEIEIKKTLPQEIETDHFKQIHPLIDVEVKKRYGIYVEKDKFYFTEVNITLGKPEIIRSISMKFTPDSFNTKLETIIFNKKTLAKIQKLKQEEVANGTIFVEKEDIFEELNKHKHKHKIEETPEQEQVEQKKDKVLEFKKHLKSNLIFASGISAEEFFYLSEAISQEEAQKSISVKNIVLENPRFSFINSLGVGWDCFLARFNKKPFICVGAIKETRIKEVLNYFYNTDIQPLRIEPAPYAAIRSSFFFKPMIKKNTPEIRIILGHGNLLAVLCCNKIPLTWEYTDYDATNFKDKVFSAIHFVSVFEEMHLKIGEIENIVVQGANEEQIKDIKDTVAQEVVVSNGPAYSGYLISAGLAIGASDAELQTINLGKNIQKPISLTKIFPTLDAVLSVIFVGIVIFTMYSNKTATEKALLRVKKQNATIAWAKKQNLIKLNAKKSELTKNIKPIEDFMQNKPYWFTFLTEAPNLLPDTIFISRLYFKDYIWTKKITNKLGKKYMQIQMMAKIGDEWSAPATIEDFVQALNSSKIYKQTFPNISIQEIQDRKLAKQNYSSFMILAQEKMNKKKSKE